MTSVRMRLPKARRFGRGDGGCGLKDRRAAPFVTPSDFAETLHGLFSSAGDRQRKFGWRERERVAE
jgi:hypothetical protein